MSDREKIEEIMAKALQIRLNYRRRWADMNDQARGLLMGDAATIHRALERAGYVVVPKEPTTAMFAAFTSKTFEQGVEWQPGAFEMFAADYRAMIAGRDE